MPHTEHAEARTRLQLRATRRLVLDGQFIEVGDLIGIDTADSSIVRVVELAYAPDEILAAFDGGALSPCDEHSAALAESLRPRKPRKRRTTGTPVLTLVK